MADKKSSKKANHRPYKRSSGNGWRRKLLNEYNRLVKKIKRWERYQKEGKKAKAPRRQGWDTKPMKRRLDQIKGLLRQAKSTDTQKNGAPSRKGHTKRPGQPISPKLKEILGS